MIEIYYNGQCSKSREALSYLEKAGVEFKVVSYLTDAPSVRDLEVLVGQLRCKAHDLIRTKEPIYLERYEGKDLTDEEWLIVIHEHPILLQRPIIVNGDRATIARSAEAIQRSLS